MATWYQTLQNPSYRMRLDVTSSANVSANTTTFYMVGYVEKLSGSGYWTNDSQSWSLQSPNGQVRNSGSRSYDFRSSTLIEIGSASFTVAGSAAREFAFHWVDTTGQTGDRSLRVTYTPQAIPVKPTSLLVTRVSDTQQKLDWSGSAVSAVVQRSTDGGPWQTVGTPGSGPVTWTDTTTSGDHKYDYRVANVAAAGQSDWSNTATVYTTPAVVGSVAAEKVGLDIRVSVTGVPPYATAFDVYDNDALVGADVSAFPWLHVSPNPAVTHTYEVVSKRDALASVESAPSNTVQLLTAPNPASNLAPNGGVAASDAPVRFSWTHNPVDTTAQTGYELRYRVGAAAWTTLTGTTASFRDVSLSEATYDWQVRTKGDHPDWSPWSAIATVTVVTRPGVAILTPAGGFDQPVLPVEWSYLQAQGRPQSGWRVELLDSLGARLEFREGSGAQTSLTLSHRLEHDRSYTVKVWAATGTVWSAVAQEAFTVTFVEPAPALVEGAWVEARGAVEVAFQDGRGPVIPDVVNLFPGIVGDGTWAEVRRNYQKNPNPGTFLGGWSLNQLSPGPTHPDGRELTVTTGFSNAYVMARQATDVPASLGDVWSSKFLIENRHSTALSFQAYVSESNGSISLTTNFGPVVSIPPGESRMVSMTSPPFSRTGVTHARQGLYSPGFLPQGAVFFVANGITMEKGSDSGSPWSGASPDFSVDPDMRQRWLSTPNASESVMEIENAAGFTAINVIAGVTTSLPRRLRLISTKASTAGNPSYALIDVPAAAHSEGTLLGTAILHELIANPTGAYRAALVVTAPAQSFPNPPNEAGEYPQRVVFSDLSSAYQARFYHGGLLGDADVYWTDIGLFAGDYDGPVFHGGSGQITVGDSVMQTSWDGAEDNSSSTASMVPASVSLDIERSINDGVTWEPWLTGVESVALQHFTDWLSLSNGQTLYRVTAWATSGAASTRIYEVIADSDSIWISGGDGYSIAARLPFYSGFEVETGRDRAVHRYAGRALGVAYAGEQLSRIVRVNGMTHDIDQHVLTASRRDLERLAQAEEPLFMVRTPDSDRVIGTIGTIPQPRLNGRGYWAYSLELTETDH